jgi:hypothetical protein
VRRLVAVLGVTIPADGVVTVRCARRARVHRVDLAPAA